MVDNLSFLKTKIFFIFTKAAAENIKEKVFLDIYDSK